MIHAPAAAAVVAAAAAAAAAAVYDACRACVRAHKTALQMQRQFWHCLLRDTIAFRDLQVCFDTMEKAEKQATGVYRR